MATSGSINFSLTAGDIITRALRAINEVDKNATPTADQTAAGMEALNLMLKSWQVDGPNIWRYDDAELEPEPDCEVYTLTPRPYSIDTVRFKDTGDSETPMTRLTRQEYFEIPNKAAQGRPTSYYFENLRDSAKLYIWPVLSSVTTETIKYSHQNIVEDVDSTANNLDIRQEGLETVFYALSDRLADFYNVTGKDIDKITLRAESLVSDWMADDRDGSIFFEPDRQGR